MYSWKKGITDMIDEKDNWDVFVIVPLVFISATANIVSSNRRKIYAI